MSSVTIERLQPKFSKLQLNPIALQATGRAIAVLALSLSLGCLTSSKSEAATFEFTKIADTNTPIPSGAGNFVSLSSPSLDEGHVAFVGTISSSPLQQGVYTNISGKLNVIADSTRLIPNSTENFSFFGSPSSQGGQVIFLGSSAFPQSQQGIYSYVNNIPLEIVANRNTSIPGGTGNFATFNVRGSVSVDPSIDAGNVAFRGLDSSFREGIYANIKDTLKTIADTKTSIPLGTGNFTAFSDAVIDDGFVAFVGTGSSSQQQGIYTNIGGRLKVVVNTKTAIPNGIGNFTRFVNASQTSEQTRIAFDNGNVVFNGFGSGSQQGIYIKVGGKLNVIADTKTPIPGGMGNFTSFTSILNNNASLDNGNVAFQGSGSSQVGIYTTLGGSLRKVIAVNDSLDGKIVSSVASGREALSGNQIAFLVRFTDGSEGIYIATLTE